MLLAAKNLVMRATAAPLTHHDNGPQRMDRCGPPLGRLMNRRKPIRYARALEVDLGATASAYRTIKKPATELEGRCGPSHGEQVSLQRVALVTG